MHNRNIVLNNIGNIDGNAEAVMYEHFPTHSLDVLLLVSHYSHFEQFPNESRQVCRSASQCSAREILLRLERCRKNALALHSLHWPFTRLIVSPLALATPVVIDRRLVLGAQELARHVETCNRWFDCTYGFKATQGVMEEGSPVGEISDAAFSPGGEYIYHCKGARWAWGPGEIVAHHVQEGGICEPVFRMQVEDLDRVMVVWKFTRDSKEMIVYTWARYTETKFVLSLSSFEQVWLILGTVLH